MRLVRSNPRGEDFERTFQESHRIYKEYQMAIHGDPPDKPSQRQYTRFLVDSPLKVLTHVSLSSRLSWWDPVQKVKNLKTPMTKLTKNLRNTKWPFTRNQQKTVRKAVSTTSLFNHHWRYFRPEWISLENEKFTVI